MYFYVYFFFSGDLYIFVNCDLIVFNYKIDKVVKIFLRIFGEF